MGVASSRKAKSRSRSHSVGILTYEHVGIRVSDRARALAFYAGLGFQEEIDHAESPSKAVEIVNEHGLRINLICNGEPQPDAHNVLQDDPRKLPGLTHIAFAVDNLQAAMDYVRQSGLRITEGPRELPRRRYFFFRDPDGNVIELNEYR
jgi:catechol 2,3-dioxygenase-like lactoylglutathione lyase family enzyme